MRLVYKSHPIPARVGTEVRVGDVTETFRKEQVAVAYIVKPHKPSSTGRIGLESLTGQDRGEVFPDVVGAEWIEREDQQ